ncbi:hypothetical protein D9619_003788 [Psilocybe cf. subviscida]|uniref:Uncharacterized protein n=1 Tax=Psilocybe cf. subviscida TaxID=2480587 RepID=A0A8H5AW27_9AGAR|nr:hypothetical protein D9619_003788 [Psilocybe cf. subviscida]
MLRSSINANATSTLELDGRRVCAGAARVNTGHTKHTSKGPPPANVPLSSHLVLLVTECLNLPSLCSLRHRLPASHAPQGGCNLLTPQPIYPTMLDLSRLFRCPPTTTVLHARFHPFTPPFLICVRAVNIPEICELAASPWRPIPRYHRGSSTVPPEAHRAHRCHAASRAVYTFPPLSPSPSHCRASKPTFSTTMNQCGSAVQSGIIAFCKTPWIQCTFSNAVEVALLVLSHHGE